METNRGSSSASKPQNPISTCASMLLRRQFSSCRDFAKSLPSSDTVARVQAIAHILSAPDLYTVLKISREDARDRNAVRQHFTKVALLLDPTLEDKLPCSDEALARAREAWRVLSDPERRDLYDRDLQRVEPSASFWTACPYCWAMSEYERIYEECTLRCQNCQSAIHGVAVSPPTKEVEESGQGQVYWRHPSIPFKFVEMKEKEEEKDGNQSTMDEEKTHVVYISSDDEDIDGLGKKVEEGVLKDDTPGEGSEKVQVQANHNKEEQIQMDPLTGTSSASANSIARCESLLLQGQFISCCEFAHRLPISDKISRIISIAEVLSAYNFYYVLKLTRAEASNRDFVEMKFKELESLLDPGKQLN